MKIYMASKTIHAPKWRDLWDRQGFNIISTWIDEADEGQTLDWPDLWTRCLTEASTCDILVVYREPYEELKGAWVEVGAALASGRVVRGVGSGFEGLLSDYSIVKSGKIGIFPSVLEALKYDGTSDNSFRDTPSMPFLG